MALSPSQTMELEVTSGEDVAIYDKYARYVQSCRRHERADIIANTAYINAQFIMGQLLLLAFDRHFDVRLLTGRLDKNTYNFLAPEFEKVLGGGNKIKIIILYGDPGSLAQNKVFELVSKHQNGRVQALAEAPDSMPHFMLVGDRAYRVEIDDSTKQAHACFNDEHGLVVGHYMKLFKEKWNNAAGGTKDDVRRSIGTN